MIIDLIGNLPLYWAHGEIDDIMRFINALSADSVEEEHLIRGRDVFARTMSYETKSPERAVLESHIKYIDIQVVLGGMEDIAWYPFTALEVKTPYDPAKDTVFYHHPESMPLRITLRQGFFAMLLPSDAHMPQLAVPQTRPMMVKKTVLKVKASLFNRIP